MLIYICNSPKIKKNICEVIINKRILIFNVIKIWKKYLGGQLSVNVIKFKNKTIQGVGKFARARTVEARD